MKAILGSRRMWTAVIFAVLMPLILWYELEHYHAHYGTGMLTSMGAMIGICFNGYTIGRNISAAVKKQPMNIPEIICTVISMIVCILVYSDAQKIPHCVECDHITTEELGYLSRWITGMDTP